MSKAENEPQGEGWPAAHRPSLLQTHRNQSGQEGGRNGHHLAKPETGFNGGLGDLLHRNNLEIRKRHHNILRSPGHLWAIQVYGVVVGRAEYEVTVNGA